MGTPVIVSDVCAGRETIDDGVSGLWFKSGNVEALAAALAQDPRRRVGCAPLARRLPGLLARAADAGRPCRAADGDLRQNGGARATRGGRMGGGRRVSPL